MVNNNLTRDQYIKYIKLQLTGGIIKLEIPDSTIGEYLDLALIKIQKYINETSFITVPFSSCIDLSEFTGDDGKKYDFEYASIVNIFRTVGFTGDATSTLSDGSFVDPMYAQQWTAFTNGGTGYNLANYVYNYLAYNTLLQMRNTVSTDLDFFEDKHNRKLYINGNYDTPKYITIEYIPLFRHVEDIHTDYWVDILERMTLALLKIALGRIRTRFTQSNALYTQDGEKILEEGNTEYKELEEYLRTNKNTAYILD